MFKVKVSYIRVERYDNKAGYYTKHKIKRELFRERAHQEKPEVLRMFNWLSSRQIKYKLDYDVSENAESRQADAFNYKILRVFDAYLTFVFDSKKDAMLFKLQWT